MANYYYVRDDGTATGDGGRYPTTAETGDWDTNFTATTEYYSDIETAIAATTPPAAGDFVLCSDIHAYVGAGHLNYDGLVEGVTVLSVDDTAMDNQLNGASETTAAASDISMDGSGVIDGVDITAKDDIIITPSLGEIPTLRNLSLNVGTVAGSTGAVTITGTGANFIAKNVDMTVNANPGSSSAVVYLQSGRQDVRIDGGSSLVAATPAQPFIRVAGDNSRVIVRNHLVDSDIGTLVTFTAGVNNSQSLFENVTHGAATLLSGTIADRYSWAKFINVDTTNGITQRDEFYYAGELHTDTGIYITADGDKEGNDFSFKMVSNANADIGREPLRILLASGYVNTATSKVFTTPILWDSASNITDADFCTEVVHQDDLTTQAHVETDHAADIFNPSDLASDSSVWTESLTNDNEQKSVVTTALTGKAGYYEIYACLYKPSTTVYVGKPVVT